MFHGFYSTPTTGAENHDGKHLEGELFDRFLSHVCRYFNVIPLSELVDCLEFGRPVPERSVVLTFDDGYASNFEVAFAILKKHEAPATIFLATEFVDEDRLMWPDRVERLILSTRQDRLSIDWGEEFSSPIPLGSDSERVSAIGRVKTWLKKQDMESVEIELTRLEDALGGVRASDPVSSLYKSLSWDQVREMKRSGLCDFGAHTHSHCILGRAGTEMVEREIALSTRIFERELGVAPSLFCYPNGKPGDFSERTTRCLSQHGFRGALTTVKGTVDRETDPMTLPRYGIVDGWSMDYFTLLMAGITR